MPAPDPHGVTIEDREGSASLLVDMFLLQGRTQRMARVRRIMSNLRRDGWVCWWCGGEVPEYRRADARYCCEGCRKRAARQRRESRPAP